VRDVGINVLANLVAAAVVYLGGVAVGLFPRNSGAIAASGTAVGLVLVVAAALVRRSMEMGRRTLVAAGLAILIGGWITFFAMAAPKAISDIPRWLQFLYGIPLLLIGPWLVRLGLRRGARDRRRRERINGLHWIECPRLPRADL
jgi:uncharacterized membrane protein (UPF0136 family)